MTISDDLKVTKAVELFARFDIEVSASINYIVDGIGEFETPSELYAAAFAYDLGRQYQDDPPIKITDSRVVEDQYGLKIVEIQCEGSDEWIPISDQ